MVSKIKKKVKQLVKKYGTNDPFKLAKYLGIIVVFEPLGSIQGYYSKSHRTKVIHINENLPYEKQLATCSHELAHAIFHPNENIPFLKSNTYFPTNRIETEANIFMIELLFNQDADQTFTIDEIANNYGIQEQFLRKFF